jgi:hypothetical protein
LGGTALVRKQFFQFLQEIGIDACNVAQQNVTWIDVGNRSTSRIHASLLAGSAGQSEQGCTSAEEGRAARQPYFTSGWV